MLALRLASASRLVRSLGHEGHVILRHFIASLGRAHAVHEIAKETLEPRVLVLALTTDDGIEVLVTSHIHVLIGGEVHNGKLRVINTEPTNGEDDETNLQSQQQGQPRDGSMFRLVTDQVQEERPTKGDDGQTHKHQEQIKVLVIV